MTYDELIKMHPDFFSENFYIECHDGWIDILESMLYTLKNHQMVIQNIMKLYPEREIDYTPLQFLQIKQKFAGLRIYASGGDLYCRGVIDSCEQLSFKICELCGNRGYKTGKSWMMTLCDSCKTKHNFD